jgi:hypothetical protein
MYLDTSTIELGITCDWSASHTGHFSPPQRKSTRTDYKGFWMGHSTGLNDVKKRKILRMPRLKLGPLGCSARRHSPESTSHVDKEIICLMIFLKNR